MRELSSENYTVYVHPEKKALQSMFHYIQTYFFGRHIFQWDHDKASKFRHYRYRIRLPNENETFFEAIADYKRYFGTFPFGQVIQSLAENGFNDERMTIGFELLRNMEVPFGYPYNSIQKSIALCNKLHLLTMITIYIIFTNQIGGNIFCLEGSYIMGRSLLTKVSQTRDLLNFMDRFIITLNFCEKNLIVWSGQAYGRNGIFF